MALSSFFPSPLRFISFWDDQALDALVSEVYRLELHGPSVKKFPQVWLVELDNAFYEDLVRARAAGRAPRDLLAEMLVRLDALRPQAVFLDLDLSEAATEDNTLSAGDRHLVRVIDSLRPERYPLLLASSAENVASRTFLGRDLAKFPRLCPVNPGLVADGGVLRRTAFRNERLFGAAYVLYTVGKSGWQQPGGCTQLTSDVIMTFPNEPHNLFSLKTRMLFRPWQSGEIQNPVTRRSRWQGGYSMPARYLLTQTLPVLREEVARDAIFIIGATGGPSNRDVYWTPVGNQSGAMIHFNSLMTLATYQRELQSFGLKSYPLIFIFVILVLSLKALVVKLPFVRRYPDIVEVCLLGLAVIPAAWLVSVSGTFINFLLPALGFKLFELLGRKPQPNEKKLEDH